MNGAHDLGGTMGFGRVVPEAEDAPHFRTDWERRAMALTLACSMVGRWSIDESRHHRENRPPASYLTTPYYLLWLDALERLLLAHGLVGDDELAAGRVLHPPAQIDPVSPQRVATALRRGAPVDRTPPAPAAFAVGQSVRARNVHPAGHTRLPRYVRGRRGVVELVHGAHVLPDRNAHRLGESPEWLYTVRFTGQELWGEGNDGGIEVSVDAWESYLEPA